MANGTYRDRGELRDGAGPSDNGVQTVVSKMEDMVEGEVVMQVNGTDSFL